MSQSPRVALLLTHTRDHYTIDRVAEEVAARGVEPVRVDVDTYPATVGLDAFIDPDGVRPALTLGDRIIEPEAVVGVWRRKLWPAPPPEGMDPQMAAACAREAISARDLWLAGFEARGVPMINDPSGEYAAENKGRQLAAARACGLAVPPTLVTNRPAAARAFWRRHGGDVVAKMLTPYSMSMNADTPFVYTNRITEADLDGLDGLRVSPMVFQRCVPKAHELRIIVVGDRAFAGRIDAADSARGATDWRRAAVGEVQWKPAALDLDLARRVCAVVRRLGLVYGAADVIVTPDGAPVFLEVNPAGEWGMIEHRLGAPIAAALADALVGAGPRPKEHR